MKTMIFLSLFISGSALACSCDYDYGRYSKVFMNRAAEIIGDIKGEDIQINDYKLQYTPMAYIDPTGYSRCGCTSFVKRIWDIQYNKGQYICYGNVILNVWNNKMKVNNFNCPAGELE